MTCKIGLHWIKATQLSTSRKQSGLPKLQLLNLRDVFRFSSINSPRIYKGMCKLALIGLGRLVHLPSKITDQIFCASVIPIVWFEVASSAVDELFMDQSLEILNVSPQQQK